MATRARPPLVLLLCLCLASCLSSAIGGVSAAGNGYRTTAFLVDEGGRRLSAELAAVAGAGGGSTAAYGDDVQRLDVYARCAQLHFSIFLPQLFDELASFNFSFSFRELLRSINSWALLLEGSREYQLITVIFFYKIWFLEEPKCQKKKKSRILQDGLSGARLWY